MIIVRGGFILLINLNSIIFIHKIQTKADYGVKLDIHLIFCKYYNI